MKAKSIKGRSAGEIRSVLLESMADGFSPTVAVVFISAQNERDAVCNVLSEKGIQVFGASAGGGFIDGEVEADSVIILLLAIKPEYFSLQLVGSGDSKEMGEQIGRAGLAAFRKPAFLVVAGGLTMDGDEIIEGIENACGKGTTIFGGLAADGLKLERTLVFTNNKVSEKGLLALILDEEKISLNGKAIGGWKPVGMDRVITKSRGNIVYEIDNEPALDFISRYAGIKDVETALGLDFLIITNFQLQLQRGDKHPVMRSPMHANKEDRSIVFAGSLPEGSKVRLCLLPGFEVIEAALKEFTAYKNEQQKEADALIMFSCAGRELSLGPYVSNEINGVKDIWDVPMAGFFCYGEIGRVANDKIEFHNMTCSLAILKEK